MRFIRSPEELEALRINLGCRPDWHEPDEQDVEAYMIGDHLDNALGAYLDGDKLIPGEYHERQVVIKQGEEIAGVVNLANLIAWAGAGRTGDGLYIPPADIAAILKAVDARRIEPGLLARLSIEQPAEGNGQSPRSKAPWTPDEFGVVIQHYVEGGCEGHNERTPESTRLAATLGRSSATASWSFSACVHFDKLHHHEDHPYSTSAAQREGWETFGWDADGIGMSDVMRKAAATAWNPEMQLAVPAAPPAPVPDEIPF